MNNKKSKDKVKLRFGTSYRVPVGLRLVDTDRIEFKRITHYNRTTMQEVIEEFVKSYIKDPSKFQIKKSMELKLD